MNRARTAAVALVAAGIMTAAAACSGAPHKPASSPGAASANAPAAAATLPGTAPGIQARWLLGAIGQAPLPAATITAHFDNEFLAKVPPSALNATFAHVKGLRLTAVGLSTSEFIVLSVSGGGQPPLTATLGVDAHGLIGSLLLTPAPPQPATAQPPATWAAVDRQIRAVAPQTRMLVARVSGGTCQPIQAIGAATAAPLGSAFKLYVLDALGDAVAAGKVRWDQPLTVTAQVKGLPPGELQTEPVGTRVPVLDAAGKMISLSDNTAADMLISLLGRPAIEASLTTAGMASPEMNLPFLTTREIYVLKLHQWPALAKRFITADESGRRALLSSVVDRAPLPTLAEAGAWTMPRDIDSLEYFGSASDLCRAYVSLAALDRRPGLSPIGQVLSVNDDGLQLDPAQWKTTWFKGGSEPGALSLAYLATTRAGQSYVVTVLAENPSQPLGDDAIPAIVAAVKGAFTLAARG
jgi:hypothetical protein